MSDINTALVDRLKALDPNRPLGICPAGVTQWSGGSSDCYLAANLNYRIWREAKIIGHVSGVALHYREQCFEQMRQPSPVAPWDYGLMAYVVCDIIKVDCAAVAVGLPKQGGYVRSLHKAEFRRGPPEVWSNFLKLWPIGIAHPGHRPSVDRQDEQMFVEGSIVLQMPDHNRRHIALRAR